MDQLRPLFVSFHSCQTQILQKKTVGFSRIQTWIVRVEGEHADHLNTTTATLKLVCWRSGLLQIPEDLDSNLTKTNSNREYLFTVKKTEN